MAIWDWCEYELDLDVRFPAPQTEDTLDCALLELSLIHIYCWRRNWRGISMSTENIAHEKRYRDWRAQ